MATFVLVHGGGHGGWCYQRVARILRGSGHEVYAPTLTGLGERAHLLSKDVDLDLHVRDVVELLFYEDLRDVILVGHSYGGMVITGVADRASDRIGRIVYLDAANPVNGQSLVDVAGPIIEATRPLGRGGRRGRAGATARAGRRGLLRRDRPRRHRVDGRAPHRPSVAELRAAARPHERGRAVGDPPLPHRLHIDLGHPRPVLMDEARESARLWDIDTGHDLMITEPQKVADALLQVAER